MLSEKISIRSELASAYSHCRQIRLVGSKAPWSTQQTEVRDKEGEDNSSSVDENDVLQKDGKRCERRS